MADETNHGTVKDLKEGRFVVIDGEPCKVVSIDVAKTGKHGAMKARVEALSLFTGSKKTIMGPVDSDIEIPIILKKNGQIVAALGENKFQVMDLTTFETFELECPEELRAKCVAGAEVEVQDVMGRKSLVRVKSGSA